MTPLARLLAARIVADGPISLADYMAECLLHPVHGYYATRDPFGAAGDFTTAPEITQMFGELLGLALAQCWLDQGRPARFLLAEIGPGRGTLMADMLRALKSLPAMRAAAEIHLIEASTALRARQRQALGDIPAQWHDRIDSLPDAPLFLVANEFFDALPIRQFRRTGAGWAERQVGLKGGQLVFGYARPAPYAALTARLADTSEGDIVETCPALPVIAGDIARRIASFGGAALIIDYGGWQSLGDTFQALKSHTFADPLSEPGLADLTAHVDFNALFQAFQTAGSTSTAMTPQGTFLNRLGLAARTEALARNLQGAARESHRAAYRRLTDASEMGVLFKVIACHPTGTPAPPGLDQA